MADEILAKNSDVKFTPHPEGQFAARCVDTINLGEKVEQFQDNPAKLVSKIALVFRTGERNPETSEYIDVGPEFTLSMGERANLRRFLEDWRGRAYTEEQVEEGVPLHKLLNQVALVSIAHKRSGKGRTYAVVKTIMPLPKGMTPPMETDYQRPDFWKERKDGYGKEAAKFRSDHEPAQKRPENFDDFPEGLDVDDDDLPF